MTAGLLAVGAAVVVALQSDRDDSPRPDTGSQPADGPTEVNPSAVDGPPTSNRSRGDRYVPARALVDVRQYGAVGDGVADDTDAIQSALDDGRFENGEPLEGMRFEQPIGLYFPPGEYLVSAGLTWTGCCVALEGAGPELTTIRLVDDAVGFSGAERRAVVTTPAGNTSFRQSIRDLTLDVGSGNDAAVGIDFIGNNTASIENVRIISSDGSGSIGLDLGREWPGPLLISDVEVTGFEVGIRTRHREYGPTFERIVLRRQSEVGFLNEGNTVAIRSLASENDVTAVDSSGSLILIDADLRRARQAGPAAPEPGGTAVVARGQLYVRDLRATGYAVAIEENGSRVSDDVVEEYLAGRTIRLHDDDPRPLALPVVDTPRATVEPANEWAGYVPEDGFDAAEFQEVLDSGARTVFLGVGYYPLDAPVRVDVPATVERIVGFSAAFEQDHLELVVDEASQRPLIVEEISDGVKLLHESDRPVVFTNGRVTYESGDGAGPLFLEDVLMSGLRVRPGQQVWARQLNVEGYEEGRPKVTNDGGDLWVLGLKTEQPGTVVRTIGGGRTEVLGTLIYPAREFSEIDRSMPAFESIDSDVSLTYSVSSYAPDTNYVVQVADERAGDRRELRTDEVDGRSIGLYVGRGGASD
jgi:hypothetical protein